MKVLSSLELSEDDYDLSNHNNDNLKLLNFNKKFTFKKKKKKFLSKLQRDLLIEEHLVKHEKLTYICKKLDVNYAAAQQWIF